MDKLYSPTTINQIRDKYGFKLSKSLGQNFLINQHIVSKIIEGTNIGADDLVIEIGPGVGVLTSPCAEIAKKVIAVELDKNLIPILKETLSEFDNVEIINQDFMKLNLIDLLEKEDTYSNVRIIGNLPYYITTPIIMKILEDKVPCESITIMVQKEVADRMCAVPGTKDYGGITISVNYYAEVITVVQVPRTAFYPNPNVDSTVLRLDIRKQKLVEPLDEELFFKLIKAGFGQRRKTLSNALSVLEGFDKNELIGAMEEAGIDPKRRGETLDIVEFSRLSDCLTKKTEINKTN